MSSASPFVVFAGVNFRALNGQAKLTFFADDSSVVSGPFPLNADYVQTFQRSGFNDPVLPSATSDDQVSETLRSTRPRYVRIQALPGANLAVREVLVLDNTYTNVSAPKGVLWVMAGLCPMTFCIGCMPQHEHPAPSLTHSNTATNLPPSLYAYRSPTVRAWR